MRAVTVFLIVLCAQSITTTTATSESTTTSPKPTTTSPKPTTTSPKPTTTTTTTPKPTTKPTPSWKAGVDEHVRKCKIAQLFFIGKNYKTAKTILDAFLSLIPKLESLTESRSLIISSKAVEMLNAISLMTEVGNSPNAILYGLYGVFHTVARRYKRIVSSLEVYIGISTSGTSTSTVVDAITELEDALYQIIGDYIDGGNIDYKPVLKSIQKLTNAIARIAESALENCENDDDVRDSLYVLVLILHHLLINGHGTNVCIANELSVRCKGVSNPWSQCLNVIDTLLNGITKALNAVVNNVVSLLQTIIDLARTVDAVLTSAFALVGNVVQSLTAGLL